MATVVSTFVLYCRTGVWHRLIPNSQSSCGFYTLNCRILKHVVQRYAGLTTYDTVLQKKGVLEVDTNQWKIIGLSNLLTMN